MILLGDIFHVWVGFRGFETPEIGAVVPALERMREAGIRIDYVEGNRDFFLGEGPYRDVFDSVCLEISFEANGQRILAVHGDGLNDQDRRYRFWRFLSKSLLSRMLMRLLPSRWARRLVTATDQRLAQTNFEHKKQIPEAVIRAYGERRLGEGYGTLILGHFHESRDWAVKGGQVRLLDAWFNSRQIEWFGA